MTFLRRSKKDICSDGLTTEMSCPVRLDSSFRGYCLEISAKSPCCCSIVSRETGEELCPTVFFPNVYARVYGELPVGFTLSHVDFVFSNPSSSLIRYAVTGCLQHTEVVDGQPLEIPVEFLPRFDINDYIRVQVQKQMAVAIPQVLDTSEADAAEWLKQSDAYPEFNEEYTEAPPSGYEEYDDEVPDHPVTPVPERDKDVPPASDDGRVAPNTTEEQTNEEPQK